LLRVSVEQSSSFYVTSMSSKLDLRVDPNVFASLTGFRRNPIFRRSKRVVLRRSKVVQVNDAQKVRFADDKSQLTSYLLKSSTKINVKNVKP
jgi:hypothetical protein